MILTIQLKKEPDYARHNHTSTHASIEVCCRRMGVKDGGGGITKSYRARGGSDEPLRWHLMLALFTSIRHRLVIVCGRVCVRISVDLDNSFNFSC